MAEYAKEKEAALIKRMAERARLERDREEMAKKTWVPVCAFCMARDSDKSRGSKLLEDWHRYDDGDHGELRFGPAPTRGSCALKVATECRDYVTPIGEGVLKQQPSKKKSAKKKAASKKPPSIYPPWPKVE